MRKCAAPIFATYSSLMSCRKGLLNQGKPTVLGIYENDNGVDDEGMTKTVTTTPDLSNVFANRVCYHPVEASFPASGGWQM